MDEANDTSTDIMRVSKEIINEPPSEEKMARLVSLINELILRDFNGLVQLLYRIDVNEKKLKSILSNNKESDSANVIADLIIERQIQKANSRNLYRQNNSSDEELW